MNGATEWRDAPAAEFAVIGDPVAGSASPRMHNAVFALLRLPFRYTAVRVPPGEVAPALEHLAALGYRGVNVTLPLKEEAFEWADAAEPFAAHLGAANTLDLRSRRAQNTDGPGFLDALAQLGLAPDTRALVLGAGGTGRAVVAALALVGRHPHVWNRTAARAEALVANLGGKAVRSPDPAGYGLIVNATSAGHTGEAPPIEWSRADPSTAVLDLSYGPAAEPFLAAARARGLPAFDGTAMLVAQGARALDWWLGVRAPRRAMLEAVRAGLGAER